MENAREEARTRALLGESDENFMRRTYLGSEIGLDYAARDFSRLKRDSAEFHTAADAVKAARARVKAKK